ncbi:hypothetical protein EZV62_028076 [Acer yangbiense]|uniref:Uncharacterized protein n=1 Tax=Acer yangbiense TaxID=1000413 RepID=A0A5C7GPI3_9ROSI|nr:hypothetical protein EZV62_028076 [Acer yangbiense]
MGRQQRMSSFIKSETSGVRVVVVKSGSLVTDDFRCDRVRIFVNGHGIVTLEPRMDRGFSLLRPQLPQKTHLSTDRGSQPLRVGIACPIAHHEKSFDAVPVQCSYSWIASDMLIWWRTGSSQAAAHHAVANDQSSP